MNCRCAIGRIRFVEPDGEEIVFSGMNADPKSPPPGHCRHCGTKLHSEASLARGECAGCFADRKQIGPDRPKG